MVALTRRPVGLNELRPSKDDPAQYHINCGSLWADRRQYDESARSYRRALAYDPNSTEAHQGLGNALLEEGQLDLAETYFREALRIDSSLPRPWISLARPSGRTR